MSIRDKFRFILIVTICVAVFIVVTEIVLRIQHFHQHRLLAARHQEAENHYMLSEIPGLIYTLKPKVHGTNSRGYWDYEYDYKKEKGVYRIIVIGDSIAAGHNLPFKDNFSKLLEQKLNNTRPQKNEVIVLARPGYGTSQEMVILEQEAFRYDPDLIIWSYALNDPAHPVFHNANNEMGRYFYKPRLFVARFFAETVFLIKEKIMSRHASREYHRFLHEVYWDGVLGNIRRIGEISRRRHVPVVFVIHPVFEQGRSFEQYSLKSLHERLRSEASDQGLEVVDLYDLFKSFDPDELRFHQPSGFDPWHLNQKGHQIIAGYLYERLNWGHRLQ